MDLEFTFANRPPAGQRQPNTSFHIAVLGDFTEAGSDDETRVLRSLSVDAETLPTVLKRLQPSVSLPNPFAPDESVTLRFEDIEDFSPDRFLTRIPAAQRLLEQRRRLLDPATSEQAAQELLSERAVATGTDTPQPTDAAPEETSRQTLERLLGGGSRKQTTPPPKTAPGDIVARLVQGALGSSGADLHPQHAALRSAVELELSTKTLQILRDPQFRRLESSWRNLDFLLRQIETDETLTVHLIHLTREQLRADLLSSGTPRETRLGRCLARGPSGDPPDPAWAVWLGLWEFGFNDDDLNLLEQLASLAGSIQTPFIGAADCALGRSERAGEILSSARKDSWQRVRGLAPSRYLGLALPRFLLRLPYGAASEPIESFPLEEATLPPRTETYVWGNPAIVCGCLLAQAFSERGPGFSPGDISELSGLPVHSYQHEGEACMTPCAEVWLDESRIEQLLNLGLMPLCSVRGRDSVRLARFQSVASPPSPLSGRWS